MHRKIALANTKKQQKRPQATRKKPVKVNRSLAAWNFSFPWKALGVMLFIVAPVIGLIATYHWINNPQNLTIKTIEVVGDLKVLNKSTLEPIIAPFVRTNLHLIDTKGLEKAIEENEWVYSAALTKIWPDKLIVKIHEQKPVAFWGKDAMLSKQGKIIHAVLAEKKGSLPMLFSPERKGRNMATEFLQIREWMKDFPVRLVEFKEDARGSWQIKLENGLVVKIGRNHHEKRIKRFMVGYRQTLISVVNKIHTVDLRYTNGFAVKWKKGQSAGSS